jgi:hypothetical protein
MGHQKGALGVKNFDGRSGEGGHLSNPCTGGIHNLIGLHRLLFSRQGVPENYRVDFSRPYVKALDLGIGHENMPEFHGMGHVLA